MDAPKLFENPQFGTVRVVMRDGDPWFVGMDVCRALDLSNVSQTISYLDDDEKGIISNDTPGGEQSVLIISESGLYSLILRSRKPEAKAFKRWITHDVLPQIRKTGMFMPDFNDPVKAARAWADAVEAKRLAESQLHAEQSAHQLTQVKLVQTTNTLNYVQGVAEHLMVNQGLAESYRKVKAIDWLKNYFNIEGAKSPFYSNCGKYMTMLSNNNKYDIKMVDDEEWGQVKAYHIDAWEKFRDYLLAGIINPRTKYIGKYLKIS